MVSFMPTQDKVPGMFGPALDCADHRRCEPRTCRFCKTSQWCGEACKNCGAPDDGDRGPLTMAPIGVIRP